MQIELSEQLKKDFKNKFIKTIDIVNFLMYNGFKTELSKDKTSLNDLTINNKNIKKALINNNYIILKF